MAEQPAAGDEGQVDYLDGIEEQLLRGKTRAHIASWAKHKFGIDNIQTQAIIDLIRGVWAAERDTGRIAARRDQLRMQYSYVYTRAMDKDDFGAALKALDGLAKIDGLMQPDVNINMIANATITSRTRERIGELMGRIQQLSAKPFKILDVGDGVGAVEQRLEEVVLKNGNGHANGNGHLKVIDHPDNPKDEE